VRQRVKQFHAIKISNGILISYLGHLEIVQLFLESNMNPNLRDSKGLSSLFFACNGGHLDIVNLLIANGVETDAEDNMGRKALHLACLKGIYNIVT
jgi:ankyrin repeat protein